MDLMKLLMGLAASGQAGAQEAPAFGNPTPLETREPFTLPNPPSAPPAPAAQTSQVEPEIGVVANRPYDFRGMFGLHGTGRSILGALGDAFLRQGGGQAVYEPRHRQELEANAMRGFVDNPLVAMQRLSRENPAAAREMYDNYQQNQVRQDTYRDSHETHALGVISSMIGTATEQNWAALRPQIERYAAASGITLPSPLPDVYDADTLNNFRRLGIPAGTQERNDETADWHDTLNTNSDEGRADIRDYRNRSLGLRGQDLALRRAQGGRRLDLTEEDMQARDEQRAWERRYKELNPPRRHGPAMAPIQTGGARRPAATGSPPSRPPTHDGQVARSPTQGNWVAQGGRWVRQ